MPTLEILSFDNNILNLAHIQVVKQSDVVVYILEEYQKVRYKYPFEVFWRVSWKILIQSKNKIQEY